jgi:ribonuclease P protein subunit POP4
MKVTTDIIRDEFIGTESRVAESRHSDYVGVSGQVVNETKNTFTIMHAGKAKNVIKEAAVFQFKFPDGTIAEIDGKLLVGRSEDRLKKNVRRLW